MEKRIFTVLFIAVFATMLGVGIIEPFMAIYAESLGANDFWLFHFVEGFIYTFYWKII